MRCRLPRYYHWWDEREGTVIEVKRDSRPFMGYGIVTMKLALGWTDASGDKQWIRWSLYRVEELCGNTVVVLVVSCRREGTASQALLVRFLKVASPFSDSRCCFDFDPRAMRKRKERFGNDPASGWPNSIDRKMINLCQKLATFRLQYCSKDLRFSFFERNVAEDTRSNIAYVKIRFFLLRS